MDYVDYCSLVLNKLIETSRASSSARTLGVDQRALAAVVFGEEETNRPDFWSAEHGDGLFSALQNLAAVYLVEQDSSFWKPTKLGREVAADITELWAALCNVNLEPEQEQLLRLVNAISHKSANDHAWVSWVNHGELLVQLAWKDGMDLLWPVAEELEESRLVERHALLGPHLDLRSTYRGLVWETRKAFTLESKFIDSLVSEWETTSVDFKREVHTDTADEKAELIKDVIGLANTQASGRRWLITGFDDKARSYLCPPDKKLTQNHIEQLMAQYTAPVVAVRYEVVDYRAGPVGKLEVLRDPKKLPYAVAKSVGDKKRIREGQVFVRHGSQTEEPSQAELDAIKGEGDRARFQQ